MPEGSTTPGLVEMLACIEDIALRERGHHNDMVGVYGRDAVAQTWSRKIEVLDALATFLRRIQPHAAEVRAVLTRRR